MITLQEAIDKYGPIENGVWKNETKWCKMFQVPDDIAKKWLKVDGPTRHIYCNADMHDALSRALKNVRAAGLVDELHTMDGAYEVRDVRGEPGRVSTHSYGLAIDIRASTNRLGSQGDMPEALVKCFTDEGFSWGGNFARRDGMHFSLAWE